MSISQSRIIVSVDPKNKEGFEELFEGHIINKIGRVTGKELVIKKGEKELVRLKVSELDGKYQKRFEGY